MGGDGTVPYASLSYASYWQKTIEVVPYELPGAEHREILKDKTFTRIVRFFFIFIASIQFLFSF